MDEIIERGFEGNFMIIPSRSNGPNSKVGIRYKALPVRVPASERKANILAALTAGFPILVDLEHKYHYSGAVGFTPRTLMLFDSYGYR